MKKNFFCSLVLCALVASLAAVLAGCLIVQPKSAATAEESVSAELEQPAAEQPVVANTETKQPAPEQPAAEQPEPAQPEPVYAELKKGDAAPDFEALLLDGNTVKLSDYNGKIVLLNFWATWCPPCIGEMPDIERVSADFAENVVVLGVNSGEDEATVRSYIEKNGYTYNIALDEKFDVMKKYPTNGIPYTLIIDTDGIIAEIHLGAGSDMYSVFEKDISALIENQP